MQYAAYTRTTVDAAHALSAAGIAADVVSLAGGYIGVQVPGHDSGHVILCRDYDGNGEWVMWAEDVDGERIGAEMVVGHVRPRDYAVKLPAFLAIV
jgi:hypothetical protein